MAIVKIGTYRNPPVDITDYEAIVSHLEAYTRQVGNQGMILTEWTNTTNAPKIAMGSYISHGGVLYVVDTEDYLLPALSSDGTYYIRVAVSGETLAVSYTTNIADYAWNAQYNSLYHPDESQVLHYQVVKNASAIEKYKMLNPWQVDDFAVVNYLGRYHGRELHVTGAISGASVDTGQGANKLYPMNQDVRNTANVGFAALTLSSKSVFPIRNDADYIMTPNTYGNVSAMSIGEMMIGYLTLQSDSSNGSALSTPTASGTYYVLVAPHGTSGAAFARKTGSSVILSIGKDTSTVSVAFAIVRTA